MSREELRLSGSGGQGLVLAGIIMAEAAILDGKNAVQTQTYGAEARGGASKSEVIISDEIISYPKVNLPSVLLAMSQEAYQLYAPLTTEKTMIIVDTFYVEELTEVPGKIFPLPISETAINVFEKEVVANIIAIGAITAITGIISEDSAREAVMNRVPQGTEKLNMKALDAGFSMGREVLAKGN
jgi:2-oxoglutarate ferredoxin oxidoreductase subunit gamma